MKARNLFEEISLCYVYRQRKFFFPFHLILRAEKNQGLVPSKDIKKIKDAQCAEVNEKLYLKFFLFLVFELLVSKRSKKMHKKI